MLIFPFFVPILVSLVWRGDSEYLQLNGRSFAFFYRPYIYFVFSVALPLLLFLLWQKNRLRETFPIFDWCIILFSAVAYAAALTGIAEFLVSFFALAVIINAIVRYKKNREKPFKRNKLLLIACWLYVLFEAFTLLWTPTLTASWKYFRLELWIGIVAIVGLLSPLSERIVVRIMYYALWIGLLYTFTIVVLYVEACSMMPCSWSACFTFDKLYFPGSLGALSPHFIVKVFPHNHYTFLAFLMAIPPIFLGFSSPRKSFPSSRYCLIAASLLSNLLYSFILQSRLGMILFPVLIVCLGIKLFWPYRSNRVLQIFALSLGALVGVVGVFFLKSFFLDGQRLQYVEIANNLINKTSFWSGQGLGTAHSFLHSVVSEEPIQHFHNQYVQCFVEGGILSLLLLLNIIGVYAFSAVRQRKREAVVAILAFALLLSVDLFVYISEYVMAIGFLYMMIINYEKEEFVLSEKM